MPTLQELGPGEQPVVAKAHVVRWGLQRTAVIVLTIAFAIVPTIMPTLGPTIAPTIVPTNVLTVVWD